MTNDRPTNDDLAAALEGALTAFAECVEALDGSTPTATPGRIDISTDPGPSLSHLSVADAILCALRQGRTIRFSRR
jgi:hypothetical protein